MIENRIWSLWEYIIDIFDCGITIFLFHSVMTPKYKKNWIPIIFSFIFASTLFLINHITISFTVIFLFTLVFISYNVIVMKDQIGAKIFWPCYCVILFNLIDSLSTAIIHYFISPTVWNISSSVIPVASRERFIDMIVSRILIAAILVFTCKKKFLPINLDCYIWLILCGVLFCSGVSVSILLEYIYKYNIQNYWVFLVIFFILLVCVLSFVLLNIFSKQSDDISKLKIKSAKAEMNKKFAKQAVSAYYSLKKWKHDSHNHIEAINQMAKKGETNKIVQYIDSLEQHFDSDCFLVATGNSYIDAIVNSKLQHARANNIKFSIKLEIPNLEEMDNFDICSLIGNLLDNAIEANQKIENINDRYINFQIQFSSPFCLIHCDNAICERPKEIKKHLISTKSGEGHGIGITQIKDITKKYDGIYQYSFNSKTFTFDIMVPVNPVQTSLQIFCYNQKEE